MWRVLRCVGLNTRSKRLALIARHRDPYERRPRLAAARAPHRRHGARREGRARLLLRRSAVRHQGHRLAVHRDRRRLRLLLGRAAHLRAQPARAVTPASCLHRVARELAQAAGWKLREVTTDNGSEFRARHFRAARRARSARASGSSAPGVRTATAASNASSSTILEECWRPAFARSLVPKTTALAQDLDEYLQRLQLRPRPHRAPHPRTRARRHRLRCPQDQPRTMTDLSLHLGVRTP